MDENPEDLLPFYALGVLSPDERSVVEVYIAAHPEAQAQLSQMQKDASALPYGADPVEPPQALKQQLMARVEADAASRRTTVQPERSRAGRGRTWGWVMPAISFASLVVALAAVIWALSLREQIVRLEAQTASLEHELNSQRTVLTQLTSP